MSVILSPERCFLMLLPEINRVGQLTDFKEDLRLTISF